MAGDKRRTQAERRVATRTALLDATVECLIEYGYGKVTVAQIAARAGVTRGAQAHYFATKAELVSAALEHAAERITDQFRADPPYLATEAESVMALVDRLWTLHDSPTFTAVVELWVASRTDRELRAHVDRLNKQITSAVMEILTDVVPDFLRRPHGIDVISTMLSTMRGVILLGFTSDEWTVTNQWEAARRQVDFQVVSAIDHDQS